MEIEKLLKFVIDYLSEYFGVLFSTLRSPRLAFPPQVLTDGTAYPQANVQLPITRLNPKLLSFILISVFIGSVFNTSIPGRSKPPDFVVTTVMVIGYWLLFSALAHIICKAFGGRAPFIQTFSIDLQVLAVIHVLSSFAAFLWGVAVTEAGSGNAVFYLQRVVGVTLIKTPVYAYFLVQFVLALIYLPLANRRVNGFCFSGLRRALRGKVMLAVLKGAENALFFIVFLALSVIIVEFSKTNYHVHKVLLSQPEMTRLQVLDELTHTLIVEKKSLAEDESRLIDADLALAATAVESRALYYEELKWRTNLHFSEKSQKMRELYREFVRKNLEDERIAPQRELRGMDSPPTGMSQIAHQLINRALKHQAQRGSPMNGAMTTPHKAASQATHSATVDVDA